MTTGLPEIAGDMTLPDSIVQFGNGFQGCYAFHRGSGANPGYLHLHRVVNMVNFRDGKRFYETYNAVTGLRNYPAVPYYSWQWSTAYDDIYVCELVVSRFENYRDREAGVYWTWGKAQKFGDILVMRI